MPSGLTTEERDQVRYHLGYPSVSIGSTAVGGQPALTQTNFLVERAMDNVLAVAIDRVRDLVSKLSAIESKLFEATDHLPASALGDLELRPDEPQALEEEYHRWSVRLAETLGVPFYEFSERHRGSGSGNIPVVHR